MAPLAQPALIVKEVIEQKDALLAQDKGEKLVTATQKKQRSMLHSRQEAEEVQHVFQHTFRLKPYYSLCGFML